MYLFIYSSSQPFTPSEKPLVSIVLWEVHSATGISQDFSFPEHSRMSFLGLHVKRAFDENKQKEKIK